MMQQLRQKTCSLNDDVGINDSDIEGDNLVVNTTPVSDVSNGILTLNSDGTYSYLPDSNFFGTDSFTYEICDDGSFKMILYKYKKMR